MQADQLFQKHFKLSAANEGDRLEQTFKIRYEVYCREFAYEHATESMQGKETDAYDSHAKHFILEHADSQQAIGCARIIYNTAHQKAYDLPFMLHCAAAIDPEKFSPTAISATEVVEFSRLAVIHDFRRRDYEKNSVLSLPILPDKLKNPHRGYPIVPVSLFLSLLHEFANGDASYGVAMMEPRLARLLRIIGIKFEQVGNVMDYHGPRAPYLIRQEHVLDHLSTETALLYHYIASRLL